jgi:MmeI, N-terminal domain
MTSQERGFQDFADFAAQLKGDEKSEAQTFLFHLLEAFGHDANTLPEGSTFEYRVRFPGQKTKFADFVWPGRVLIEMKSRGEKLSWHYQQTFDYWLNLVPHRPPYVVLATSTNSGFTISTTNCMSRWIVCRSGTLSLATPR